NCSSNSVSAVSVVCSATTATRFLNSKSSQKSLTPAGISAWADELTQTNTILPCCIDFMQCATIGLANALSICSLETLRGNMPVMAPFGATATVSGIGARLTSKLSTNDFSVGLVMST